MGARDIVGGDCYWTVKNNNHIWFGLFDCTGHGIPGAFVTLILLSKLSRIFHNARGFSDFRPSTLLEEVDKSLKDSFNRREVILREKVLMDVFCYGKLDQTK